MKFLAELRRRNVIRMAGLYLVAAWLVTQVAGTLLPMFEAPAWIARAVVVALAIGFVPAMVVAWAFELTPQGLKRDADVPASESIAPRIARRMDRAIIVVLAFALGYFAFDKFVLAPRRELAIAAEAKKAGEATSEAAATAKASDKSIAVLPLSNESGDKDQQYFSDGLTDDMINALMQFDSLKVIGRTSAFQFRDSKEGSAAIGAKLGVAYLLTGSVRKLGDTVRINAQLVKAADGSGVWSQSYDRPYTDLFKLQDEIAASVAGALKAKLLQGGNPVAQNDRPPSGNLDAYNAYQQGRFYAVRGNQPDVLTALEHFREAIRLDPRYAAAWVEVGYAQARLASNYLTGAEVAPALAKAQEAIDAALRLNPDLAQAHAARAYLMRVRDFDFDGSLAEYRRALELAPNDPRIVVAYALGLAMQGQVESAFGYVRKALALDPLQASSHSLLSTLLASTGRMDAARAAIGKAVEVQPRSNSYRAQQARIEAMSGNAPRALALAQALPPDEWRDYAMASVLQDGPDRAAADAALQALIDRRADSMAYQIAEVYAQRRDLDNAFKWLDRAWANRDPGVAYLLYDPYLLRLKDDPRFAAFTRKVGLPATTDARALP